MRVAGMCCGLLLAFLLAVPIAAKAAESNSFASREDTVSLVSRNNGAAGRTFTLGLLFRLSKGWHIYWKDAGDAGSPPQLALLRPDHATIGRFHWPAPDWLVTNSVGDYVVGGTVLLPFSVTLPKAHTASGIEIRAAAHWLVCSAEICVPQQAMFTLNEPAGPNRPSAEARLFEKAAALEPKPSPFETEVRAGGVLIIRGEGLGTGNVKWAHFFPDRPDTIANAAPQRLEPLPDGFSLTLTPNKWRPGAPLTGILEIADQVGSVQAFTIAAQAPPTSIAPWIWTAISALVGGLLLNIMPCVFPVLAMKALGIARLGAADRSTIRAQALAYTAGAVLTMWAIGIILTVLRIAGTRLGWGFQLQSPAFVTFLTWLVFAIGLNLAGVFEIGSRFAGLGSKRAMRGGIPGSFATGFLAVVVATPCTAPFMGAAIASALAAPPGFACAIFVLLGFGMALPFLLIGFFPDLGRLLPKPGPWMILLKQLLAFPMFVTAAWLLWVVALQAGAAGVLTAAIGMVLLGFALWLSRFGGWIPRIVRLSAFGGALAMLPFVMTAGASARLPDAGAVPFSATRLAAALSRWPQTGRHCHRSDRTQSVIPRFGYTSPVAKSERRSRGSAGNRMLPSGDAVGGNDHR
jgi:DsbC/DsbD-like thiol-disulfide interchange protein/cytochrome c biogenesis protein CcdA